MSKQPFIPLQHPENGFRLDHKLQQELFAYSKNNIFAIIKYALFVGAFALVASLFNSKLFIALSALVFMSIFPFFFWRVSFFSLKGFKCSHCNGKLKSQSLRSRSAQRTNFLTCYSCKTYADTGVRQGNNHSH